MRNNADAGRRRRLNGARERANAKRRIRFSFLGIQRAAHETCQSAFNRAMARGSYYWRDVLPAKRAQWITQRIQEGR